MRQIEDLKFRLWHTERKHWIAVGMTIVDFQKDASVSLELPLLTCESGVVVQQFTGLKDINGVDIYEGDFIEWQEFYSKKSKNRLRYREPVTFLRGVFWADLPLYEVNEVCKIVGNIFEDKFVPEDTKKS